MAGNTGLSGRQLNASDRDESGVEQGGQGSQHTKDGLPARLGHLTEFQQVYVLQVDESVPHAPSRIRRDERRMFLPFQVYIV